MIEIDSPRFLNSIYATRMPWSRWAAGLAANSALVLFLLIVSPAIRTGVENTSRSLVTLIDPTLAPPPPVPLQKKPVVTPVRVKPVQPVIHKTVTIMPTPKPQPVKIVTVEPPKIIAPEFSAEPIVKTEIAPARPVTRESGFQNVPTPSPAPTKAGTIRTGAFGDPNGVPASASARPGPTLARLGSFDAAGASGGTSGSARYGNGAVTTGGFGSVSSGSGSGAGGGSQGSVRSAGFGQPIQQDAAPREVKPAQPAETPVEITSKPRPVYTPEAREHKIEGEVQFQVLFSASGQVHIIRMLRGLGWGLDERARDAANQIHFRPGTRNGVPVDMTGTVHIVFELS